MTSKLEHVHSINVSRHARGFAASLYSTFVWKNLEAAHTPTSSPTWGQSPNTVSAATFQPPEKGPPQLVASVLKIDLSQLTKSCLQMLFKKNRQEYKFFHSHSLSSNFYWFLHCRVKATRLPCPPVLTALLLAIHQFVSLLPIPSHCSRNISLFKQKYAV